MRYPIDVQLAAAMLDGVEHAHLTLDPARLAIANGAFMTELAGNGDCQARRAEAGVDCVFFVISGRARVLVRGTNKRFAAGDSFVVRACETYNLSNASDSALRALEVQLPSTSAATGGQPDTCSDQGRPDGTGD